MIFDLPPIPFSVHDHTTKKTVYVVSSCDQSPKTVIVKVDETAFPISKQVFTSIHLAFNTNGITIVSVCRVKRSNNDEQ